MVRHLYPNFLKNSQEYEYAERYWREMIEEIARQYGQAGEWRPHVPRQFLDGTPMSRDGNPIYDARSERLGRAIQVIQWPPESSDVAIAAWLDTYDFSEAGGTGPTDELVLNLALSEESASVARELIERWMNPETSYEEMEMIAKSVGGTG